MFDAFAILRTESSFSSSQADVGHELRGEIRAGRDFGVTLGGHLFDVVDAVEDWQLSNAEVALDIIKYFTSADAQIKIALKNKTIPAATAALKDPQVAALATLAGFGQALTSGVPMANTPFASAQWGPVGDATVAIWTGAQKPEEALKAAQTAIDTAIAQMK